MTEWGIDTLFNPGKRHMDEEKRRLQSTREEIGDSSGGKRIDLESGVVRIARKDSDDDNDHDDADGDDTAIDDEADDEAPATAEAEQAAEPARSTAAERARARRLSK